MQDRFRFRVWNIKNKEMIYNAEIAYDGVNYNTKWQIGNNTNDGHVDCFGYYLDYEHEDYEIMQSTGLKDKNGKLIYEGDIVKEFLLYKVIWEKEFCRFELQKVDDEDYRDWLFDTTDDNQSHRIEVIGNIYENPELLEN